MRRPKGVACHNCAPKEWRRTPRVTGDYDFDESIMRNGNKDMARKLKMYRLTDEPGYGPRTGYNGYSGYSGDE